MSKPVAASPLPSLPRRSSLSFKLCAFSVLLASIVVVLGAFTRLADAGLGCPDWPTCYGHLWVPETDQEVAKANAAFAETPVEHDKTWPEQLHRIVASTLGLFILAIFFCAIRASQRSGRQRSGQNLSVIVLLAALVAGTVTRIFVGDAMDMYLWGLVALYFLNLARLAMRGESYGPAFKLTALLAGLVILQGLFGMWTVTLNLWPQVVTLHLLGGFATLNLLWLLLQRLGQWHWQANAETVLRLMQLRLLALIALIAVVFQIALGGWVSSNYAALACPDFPLCQNALFPQTSFANGFNFLQDIGPNYLGGQLDNIARVTIHVTHRLGALIVLAIVGIFIYRLWHTAYTQAKNIAMVLAGVLVLQLSLGVLNIVLSLPLFIAVAHNAVGAVLLMTLVMINHRLRTTVTL